MSSKHNNTCAEFAREAVLYLGHELPAPRQKFWEGHLRTCADCRSQTQAIRETLRVYDSLPLAELDETWYSQALKKATQTARQKNLRLFSAKPQRVVAATLALAAGLLLFFLLLREDHSPDALAWEGSLVDLSLSEIDSTISVLGTNENLSIFSYLNYEESAFESQIDELESSIRFLAEDMQNSL